MESKVPKITITGIGPEDAFTIGSRVFIDDVEVPAVRRVVAEFNHEDFAEVTVTVAGKIDLELLGYPQLQIGEAKPFTCPVCKGRGKVPKRLYEAFGSAVGSTSNEPEVRCRSCKGKGYLR